MQDYTEYAKHIGAPEKVLDWLKNRLGDNGNQEEIEHIIDYLASDEAPNNITAMTYAQAKKNTDKWVKTLMKRGEHIKESPEDTEVFLDFGDGFKIVKLVGKAAFEREGYLMRHCAASYAGRTDTEVYSLRDKDNMPHCTMEKDQQVKGKGNGDIHPKYVDYVVKFLEHTGMTVGDGEMRHLGYVNAEALIDELSDTSKALLYSGKYFPKSKRDQFLGTDDKPIEHIGMLECFDLVEARNNELHIAFDIPALVSASISWISKRTKQPGKVEDGTVETGGNNAQLAGGYNAQLAGGNNAQLAGGDNAQLAGGNYAQLAGGYNAQLAGGYNAQLAGGDNAQLAGGNYAHLAGGYNAQLAGGYNAVMVGDHRSIAKGGLGSVLVLVERQTTHPYAIIAFKAEQVDGKRIKADQWYKLVDGEFVETESGEE